MKVNIQSSSCLAESKSESAVNKNTCFEPTKLYFAVSWDVSHNCRNFTLYNISEKLWEWAHARIWPIF